MIRDILIGTAIIYLYIEGKPFFHIETASSFDEFMVILGAIFYFVFSHATGSGFFAGWGKHIGPHYVNKGTPSVVWKILGASCWLIGLLYLLGKIFDW